MEESSRNVSDHLANERTFLAWIRTAIGIMAFGFVVVKFALFVKQVALMMGKPEMAPHRGYSSIVGIILVAVGLLTIMLSFIRYRNTSKQIALGNYKHSSVLLTLVTFIIMFVGILLIVYLVETT